jgi:hypothetical protein
LGNFTSATVVDTCGAVITVEDDRTVVVDDSRLRVVVDVEPLIAVVTVTKRELRSVPRTVRTTVVLVGVTVTEVVVEVVVDSATTGIGIDTVSAFEVSPPLTAFTARIATV